MNPTRKNQRRTIRRLWWLDPAWLFAVVIGATMLAAAWQDEHAFRLYGTPKFIGAKHVALAAVAIAVFAIGSWLAHATSGRASRPEPGDGRVARIGFWVTTGLTLFGYAVWFAVGLKNGFSLGTLREFLTTDDPALAESIRDEIFINLKGITTCTQFGIAAVPLGLWLYFHGYRQAIWGLAIVVGLAAVRALVFSERLALIELLVPAAVVAIRFRVLGQPISRWSAASLPLAPVAGVVGLVLLFGGFEYFRSWRYYRDKFDSYAEFTLWRVSGYYTTAHNNSAMALETQPMYPLPYATLRQFWSIPGLASTPLGYTKLTGVDPTARHLAMLEQFGTPELNNEGGLFQPALDFGLAGYVLFWFGCGFVAALAYRAYLSGSLGGLMFYPLIFVAILETPRFLYLCYPRSLPAIVALAMVSVFAMKRCRESARGLPLLAST